MFMKRENSIIDIDKVTIIDLTAIDNFINLYNIYLEKKRAYDSCIDSVNARFSIDEKNDIIQEIYLKILQINMEKLDNFLSSDSYEAAQSEIIELRRFSNRIKNYKTLFSMFNISDSDTFSKFIGYKSLREIEKEVRSKYSNCSEVYIMTTVNEIYSSQDEVLRKKINELYNELISAKKYIEILVEYENKLKNSSFLMSLFTKSNMNKKLKEELKKDSNKNFLSILSKSGDVSVLVVDEIKKYLKYILPITVFTEKVYGDAIKALNTFDENENETQISEDISVVKNNQTDNSNIQKLRDLYDIYGVDNYYLDSSSLLWQLNYNEALVKLRFCEDYYMANNNCSAEGTVFQVEVLFMNSIEFQAKFDISMSDIVDKYGIKQEINDDEENNYIHYQKAM